MVQIPYSDGVVQATAVQDVFVVFVRNKQTLALVLMPTQFLQVLLGLIKTVDLNNSRFMAEYNLFLAIGNGYIRYLIICLGSLPIGKVGLYCLFDQFRQFKHHHLQFVVADEVAQIVENLASLYPLGGIKDYRGVYLGVLALFLHHLERELSDPFVFHDCPFEGHFYVGDVNVLVSDV